MHEDYAPGSGLPFGALHFFLQPLRLFLQISVEINKPAVFGMILGFVFAGVEEDDPRAA